VTDETPRTEPSAATEDGAAAEDNAAAEREAAAFADIIGRFHDDMARVSFVVSGDVELAAEAAQGAWPEAWKDLRTPRNAERLRAWLMGLAAKEAKWLADAGSRARAEATRGDAGIVPATSAAASAAYRSDELDLANTFATMDSHDRQIVALRYVAGLSSDDIGRELGMPGSAVQARVARILKQLLEAVRNLEVSGDSVEVYERALAQRIRAFATRAVAPLDPDEIARAAIAHAAAEVSAVDRLREQAGVLWERLRTANPRVLAAAAGGFVIVFAFVLFGGRLLGGGGGDGGVPIVTPFPTDATRLCEPQELQLRVIQWAAAGTERTATVQMTNVSNAACLVDNLPEPWLVEAPQLPMIIGTDFTGTLIRIGPGDVFRTSVHVRNYCGPDPKAPVTLAFRRDNTILVADALTATDLSGVPGCGGYAQSPEDVRMVTPWGY
jgi:DNA-directed RNA polymerase specialized sigma24 family protein